MFSTSVITLPSEQEKNGAECFSKAVQLQRYINHLDHYTLVSHINLNPSAASKKLSHLIKWNGSDTRTSKLEPRIRPLQPLRSREHGWYRNATAVSPTDFPLSCTSEIRVCVRMSTMGVIDGIIIFRGLRTFVGKHGAKEEVLHDWQLAQYFGKIHLDHPAVDLVPSLDLISKG